MDVRNRTISQSDRCDTLNIKQYREEHGITAREIVEAVKVEYPKYDKYLHSKVERPEEYGITLVPHALKLAMDVKPQEPRREARRKLQYSVRCRLTKKEFEQLQRALRRQGYSTVQGYLRQLIKRELERS